MLISYDGSRALLKASHYDRQRSARKAAMTRAHTRAMQKIDELEGLRQLELTEQSDEASEKAVSTQSVYGTKSYNDGLRRAFNRAKTQVYFNPDMKYFITLTYKGSDHSLEKVLNDVKVMIKREKRNGNKDIKYIYVMEYQKRGSIHVHMVASKFTTYTNKNGYKSLSYWPHGFSSALQVDDFDDNFKPNLYLFKYMKKAQRIGRSFLHSSRNLDNYLDISNAEIDHSQWSTILQERTNHKISKEFNFIHYRYYLKYDNVLNDTIKNGVKYYGKKSRSNLQGYKQKR